MLVNLKSSYLITLVLFTKMVTIVTILKHLIDARACKHFINWIQTHI